MYNSTIFFTLSFFLNPGIIATGIFAKPVPDMHHFNYGGLIYGGGWYLMSVQALEAVVIIAWTVGMTLPALWVKLSKFEIQNIT